MATATRTPVNGAAQAHAAAPPEVPQRRRRTRKTPPAPAVAAETLDDDNDDTLDDAPATGAPPIVKRANDQDFWEYLSLFTRQQWSSSVIAYLYRTAPIIDRKMQGKASYIVKFVEPFDQETIKRTQGSGGYRVDLLLRNEITGGSHRIAQNYFTIMDPDFPPKLAAGDWVDAPENADWQWAKPAIEAKRVETAAAHAEGGTGALKTVLDYLDRRLPPQDGNPSLQVEMQRGINNLTERLVSANDPTKQLDMLGRMMDHLSPKSSGTDPLITMLMEDRKTMREEMAELRKISLAPQKPLLEQLGELIPTAQKLIGLVKPAAAATAGGSTESLWIGVLDKLADHIPDILSTWRASTAVKEATAGQQPRTGFQLRHPTAAGAAPPPSAAPDVSQTAAQAAAATAAAPNPQEAPPLTAEEEAKYSAMLQQFGELIQSVVPFMIDHFRNDLGGHEFREWFISRKGLDNFKLFKEGTGAEALTALAQTHPVLRVTLTPRDKLLAFLTDFFDDSQQDEGEPAE